MNILLKYHYAVNIANYDWYHLLSQSVKIQNHQMTKQFPLKLKRVDKHSEEYQYFINTYNPKTYNCHNMRSVTRKKLEIEKFKQAVHQSNIDNYNKIPLRKKAKIMLVTTNYKKIKLYDLVLQTNKILINYEYNINKSNITDISCLWVYCDIRTLCIGQTVCKKWKQQLKAYYPSTEQEILALTKKLEFLYEDDFKEQMQFIPKTIAPQPVYIYISIYISLHSIYIYIS